MNYFECCHHCIAPKRYPGCSSKCLEYATARARYEEDKARHVGDTSMRAYTMEQVIKNKDKVAKRKRETQSYRNL